jgi:hypothetical protein
MAGAGKPLSAAAALAVVPARTLRRVMLRDVNSGLLIAGMARLP